MSLTSSSKVNECINQFGLFGVMNNTKWNALFSALNDLEELISYRVTYIDGSTWPEVESSQHYTSELAQIWGNFRAIEFVDIDARISYSKGVLMEPEIIDYQYKIINICSVANTPISLENGVIRVWGYLKHGVDVPLHKYT